jgi:hypothetical protein
VHGAAIAVRVLIAAADVAASVTRTALIAHAGIVIRSAPFVHSANGSMHARFDGGGAPGRVDGERWINRRRRGW